MQNSIETIKGVRARLQPCRKMPDLVPALAAAGLQITENTVAGAKAQHCFVPLPARLKSCPDTSNLPYDEF
jgi:hypothetical protein